MKRGSAKPSNIKSKTYNTSGPPEIRKLREQQLAWISAAHFIRVFGCLAASTNSALGVVAEGSYHGDR